MKQVLVPLAHGFEEIETVTIVDILRRAGARVILAGTASGPIKGSRGVVVVPDALLQEVLAQSFDLVVLPGGQPGTDNLMADERVKTLLKSMQAGGKPIAAICAAPLVLHAAGILAGRTVTSHPSVKERLRGVTYSENRVVRDGQVVTSRGPGTALEFALALVDLLFGPDMVDKVNQGVMARI